MRAEEAKRIAAGILNGVIADTTGGATHYYSPQNMTRIPLPAQGQPNANGFETIPNVADNENHPAQNTFPSWSRSSDFERRPMPTISERYFRFYKQTKQGRVR